MISSQQLKQILTFSFTNGSSFVAPTCSIIATPSLYTTDSVPGSVVITGTLVPNDGTNISWTLTASGSTTALLIGTGNSLTYNIPSVPAIAGSYSYNWNITYEDNTGTTLSLVCPITITVTASAKYGQLANPGDNIVIAADLTPAIEGTLTVTNQSFIINLFPLIASNTGRIVIVVPDSYGAVTSITDNTNLDVTSQFNIINDVVNSRKIYVGINAVTPNTYYFRINF